MNNWKNKKILIIGAARQGLALARFLSSRHALVTLNDIRPVNQMQDAIQSMQSFPLKWELGHHDFALLNDLDLICVSGGVPLDLPLIQEAFKLQIPVSNDSQIFMEITPCKVIGITGSAGKTTTTSLVGRMGENAVKGSQKCWVGGNIGRPLIDVIDQITPEDIVILEFSSFQLELMHQSPQISAILNITPNHLDRHGTMEAYTAVKSHIFQFQEKENWTILGSDDPGAWQLRTQVPGRIASFGLNSNPPFPGAFVRQGMITLFDGQQEDMVMSIEEIELRGQHNLLNVLAACAVAQTAGFPNEAMRKGVLGFKGVPHRLEFIRTFKGADWYNDSKATTPEGSVAAIRSFDEPLIVLLGGRDKHLPWDNLAVQVRKSVDHLIAFGEAAEKVLAAIGNAQDGLRPYTIDHCSSLLDAVKRAADLAESGDVVLLAPGGTSFDEFNNYEERGERFREWVNKLT